MISPDKHHAIVCLSLVGLESLDFPPAIMQRLTDGDVQDIAQLMADLYIGGSFWDDLNYAVERVMAERGILL